MLSTRRAPIRPVGNCELIGREPVTRRACEDDGRSQFADGLAASIGNDGVRTTMPAGQRPGMDVQAGGALALRAQKRKQAVLWWGQPRAHLKGEAPETRTRYVDAYTHTATSPPPPEVLALTHGPSQSVERMTIKYARVASRKTQDLAPQEL